MSHLAIALLLAAGPSPPVPPAPEHDMKLTSPAFADQAQIPRQHSCEGSDRSPALAWSDLPAGTVSLVLIVDDPDAPDPARPLRTWVHWVLYDIPPSVTGLAEGQNPPPPGTRQGINDWRRTGYGGPCPPIGRHCYFHKLYALDTMLGDQGVPDKGAIEAAMKGHVLAEAILMGTYQKGDS